MKNKIVNFIVYVSIWIITLILIIGVDIWQFQLNWNQITKEFILNKSLLALLFVIICIITSFMVYDLLELKDKEYVEIETVLKDNAVQIMGSKFNNAIYKLDWSEKKKAWIKKQEMKKFNLNAKASKTVKRELLSKLPEQYSKKTIRYLEKESEIDKSLTQEWINQNLYITKINYETIEPNEVLYGSIKNKEKKSKLVRNPLGKKLFLKVAMLVPTLASTIIFSILTPPEEVTVGGVVILLSSLLFTLLINTLVGIKNGWQAHKLRLGNSRERYSIMVSYREGELDKLDEVPKRLYETYKLTNIFNKTEEEPETEVIETETEIIEKME